MKYDNNFNIKKSFGNKIKYYRSLNGLTQSQLANTIGRAEETISHIERGLNSTSLGIIQKIVEILSVEISDLFDFNDYGTIRDKEKLTLIKEVIEILNDKDKKFIIDLLGVLNSKN
ncbi:helix-turn-helix domain-containing protein [Rickettsiales bacterium]|nr:helix-turn-helix domain-containing protein [Rickettsiales bacterium]